MSVDVIQEGIAFAGKESFVLCWGRRWVTKN